MHAAKCQAMLKKLLLNHRPMITAVVAMTVCLAFVQHADARVRLENICTVHGQKEIRLTGWGLIVGLDGTGDGKKAVPMHQALAAGLKALDAGVFSAAQLQDAENVAIVMISAVIPEGGLQRGQKVDCQVSSFYGATDLRGGELLIAPLRSVDRRDQRLIATAAGSVHIDSGAIPTRGRVINGTVVEIDLVQEQEFLSSIVYRNQNQDLCFKLLLDESHASFLAAHKVAKAITDEFSALAYSADPNGSQIAKAISPGVIEVKIPSQYAENPIEFISEVLLVNVDSPNTEAKVIVNTATNTVIVTSEVEIDPTLISHPNLEITIGPGQPRAPGRFVDVRDPDLTQTSARLDQLIQALQQLKVPPESIIEVLRDLHKSGKLHATYIER